MRLGRALGCGSIVWLVAACSGAANAGAADGGIADAGGGTSADGASFAGDCASGTVTLYSQTFDGGAASGISGVTADAESIYFARVDGAIQKVPRCGGPIVTVATIPQGSALLAIDAMNLYAAYNTPPSVEVIPLSGGATVTRTLPNDQPFRSFTCDGTNLYFIGRPPVGAPTELRRAAVAGGESTVITTATTQNGFSSVTLDATNLYYTDEGDPGVAHGQVYAMSLTGSGAPNPLSSALLHGPVGIALYGDNVFIADQGSTVYSIPKAGGPPKTFGSGINNAGSIAVNGTYAYYSNSLQGTATLLRARVAAKIDSEIVITGTGTIGPMIAVGASIYFSFNEEKDGQGITASSLVRTTP